MCTRLTYFAVHKVSDIMDKHESTAILTPLEGLDTPVALELSEPPPLAARSAGPEKQCCSLSSKPNFI